MFLVLGSSSAVGFVAGRELGVLGDVSECDEPMPAWLACEDFEDGAKGWSAWFAESPWVECLGCPNGVNDPARIRLEQDPEEAHTGDWSLHMPAHQSAGFRGASLTYRSCADQKRPGCRLEGHEELYFRTWVRLAEDHEYVHHFLSVDGTRPDGYWDSDGNAGCRPEGTRWAGTTLDFNADRELFFYTYYPEMRCDSGNYCSGDYARRICQGCAAKGMPCGERLECCWGNHFSADEAVILPRGEWVCLEIGLRLNTPGLHDGWMAFWVNGELGHREAGMHWRDVESLQMNKAWLQHYIAGDEGVDQSNRVWFDDVVVSTERIGCGGTPPTSTPGTEDTQTATPSTAPPVDETRLPPSPTVPPQSTPPGTWLFIPSSESR